MIGSRLTAVGLVAAAALWIASGHFMPHESAESRAAPRTDTTEARKLFRVAVIETSEVMHARKLTISGRTEADKRVMITARTGGVLTELRIKRGTWVKEGDVIAVLSDDARAAQVMQAKALVTQRQAELDAKRRLIATGAMPKLDLVNLEAQLAAAEGAMAMAEAERDRGIVRAPWTGVIGDLSVEVGQAAFSFQGRELAQLVALDPMLAVVEVAERKLASVKIGDEAEVRLVTGVTARGKVRYVAKTASQTTRTYRVEIELPNRDLSIPDGITAEISLPLAAVAATQVSRSALTIASNGNIGVRVVSHVNGQENSKDNIVGFMPIAVVEDEQSNMWVTGIPDGTRVIVQGQDFVREGQKVDPVAAADLSASVR
ncbi:MAG TPA: efflux RND transporter periplasmic adaptor subunit [Xanthobacteraceae bacterium]|jgi:multidrug efflux system membrane fusion protein|nr:efflux RND transporter periplasmic adaptor subunit [Xanthobacteraceae bacterium]